MTTLSLSELRTLLPDVTLLEALPEKYFADGHLPGARRIDVLSAVADAARVVADKAALIVVYCASVTCQNSHQAAGALERAGYSNVRVFADGKAAWLEAGLPLER
jgi:rhodanese-related sulfurtransferase